uniref:Uncharacterized protein n=1 Tax=Neoizziella asiatica TaxID=1077397 RepID=A0A1G4NXA9_9FLOR|nr:Hypothetical protein ORF_11 [Neoizziella asiatica]SCW23264.1 Hypothetical protein ORF_11 [Neoizziella asiatica]
MKDIKLLISITLDNIYCQSSVDISFSVIDYVLLSTNLAVKYCAAFLLMSHCCMHMTDDLFLEVMSCNLRAINIYCWLDMNLIYSKPLISNIISYLKLKSTKSKTKNYYRKYLIY